MLLLVAATERELCGHAGLVCGVGPVEAAAAVGRALATGDVEAVIHVGIAGAGRSSGIPVGRIVVGSEAVYEDLTVRLAPRTATPAPWLVDAVAAALRVVPIPIGTTASVGAGQTCDVEAMEGFAVLRASELAGVFAVEIRAISNHVEDDRSDWRIDEAVEALATALPALLDVVRAAVRAREA